MMDEFLCWEKDESEEDARTVSAIDAEHAAVVACDEWNGRGRFAGDPIPMVIEVCVRDTQTRKRFLVEVRPEYEVSFYAGKVAVVDEG